MSHAQSTPPRAMRSRRRSGMVLPLTGFTFFAMICFAGLALDTGHVYIVGQQLQAAADASALSGAAQVQFDQAAAVSAAISTASKNKEDQSAVVLANADVQVGNYDRSTQTFTVNAAPYNAVHVTARATTNLLFAPVINLVLNPGGDSTAWNTSNVSRQAIAMAGGTLGAGIVVLDPTRQGALSTNGNTTIAVSNGGIQVNSSSTGAVDLKGSAGAIDGTELRVNGGMSTSGHPSVPSKTYTNTTSVGDPLAALPEPTKTTNLGSISQTKKNTTVNAVPGYYAGGLTLTNGTLNLSPGVYVLGPPGLSATGGTLNAPGVMFYITTGTGSTYGGINFSTAGTLTPPTTGTYAGISIFMDRSAPYTTSVSLGGNTQMNMQGTLYLPSTGISLGGTSNFFGNQIIADTISVSGNGELVVQYDGRNPVTINDVFLVK